jgi:hypothetical protein
MTKLSLYAIAPLALLVTAPAGLAQQFAGHCSQCQSAYGPTRAQEYRDSFHDNLMWPKQYVGPSRRGICQAFELQIANGWRRNNLLGKYDFAPNGEGLSEAGRLRVQWILTNAPPHRRTIYVTRAADAAVTAERVAAVQLLAADLGVGAGPFDVRETYMVDEGRPAASVDAVFTGFGANQPPPMLPASTSSSSGDEG